MSVDPQLFEDAALSPLIRYDSRPSTTLPKTRVTLVTGGTGFLGAHLVSDLLTRTSLSAVCVVRVSEGEDAHARLRHALAAQRVWRPEFEDRIRVVAADLSRPGLGLSDASFASLAASVDVIYHAAAELNLFFPYRVLKAANVGGTHEMLRLAALGQAKAFHHVSSLSVFGQRQFAPSQELSEEFDITSPPPDTSGYAMSKWAAERLVSQAAERGLAASIYRPCLIHGHSETGICNMRDAFSLVLTGCIRLRVAPALDAMIHLTSVDMVSRAIVELSRTDDGAGKAFHLINPAAVSWQNVAEALLALGYVQDIVPFDEWRRLVSRVRAERGNARLEPLCALLARPKPPFSAARRNVSRELATLGLKDLAFPSDHVTLVGRYAAHLARVWTESTP